MNEMKDDAILRGDAFGRHGDSAVADVLEVERQDKSVVH